MKTVVSCFLVLALLWTIVPESAGDLPAYNDGTTGTINVGTVNAKTNVNAAAGVFTNSLTLNGSTVLTNVSGYLPLTGGTLTGALISTNASTSTTPVEIDSVASTSVPIFSIKETGTTIYELSRGVAKFKFTGNGANSTVYMQGTSASSPALQLPGASGSFGLGFSGSSDASGAAASQLVSPTTATLQMGVNLASAVTPQTFKASDGTGTDKNGSSFIIGAGKSTGSGVPGDLVNQTGLYTNSSGSAVNVYTTRSQIVGRPCALTNATATSFQRFTMATNTQAGIHIFGTVTATDASFNKQSISSSVRVDAVNVSGTITATASETDNTLAANTGTLTIAYTVVDEGSNVLAIRANANSSLTTPTVKIKWVIQSINSDGAITVTPVQL